MANKILAVLEQRDGLLKRSSFETVSAANKLASELNLEAEAVVVGNEISNINDVGNYGISKVVLLKNAELVNYSSSGYRDAIACASKAPMIIGKRRCPSNSFNKIA